MRNHLALFIDADNNARRRKTLKGLTPAQFIWRECQAPPETFIREPCSLISGLYNWLSMESPVHFCLEFNSGFVLFFFQPAPEALIWTEACPGSQWFARKLIEMGHGARIIPARFVKPYVKSNKADMEIGRASCRERV